MSTPATTSVVSTPFYPYPSIENSYRSKFVDRIKQTAPADEKWIATEKIHGCNVSFILSGKDQLKIQKASRHQTLASHVSFFRLDQIEHRYTENLRQLYSLLSSTRHLVQCQVFAELYGGYAPGSKTNEGAIQKGVIYSDKQDIRVFDIMLWEPDIPQMKPIILDYDQVIAWCQKCNLPFCPILHGGSLADLLELNPVFISTVATVTGFEDADTNFAEGYVLKPVEARFTSGGARVILKHKNPTFSESNIIVDEKKNNIVVSTQLMDHTALYRLADRWIALHLTLARLDNVLSQLTDEQKKKDRSRLVRLLIEDVFKEGTKDTEQTVTPNEAKIIRTQLGKGVSEFLAKCY